jgi:hypothetical protein
MFFLLEHLDEKNNHSVIKRNLMVVALPPHTHTHTHTHPHPQTNDPVTLIIGRKVESDLQFPNDKSISRQHCRLTIYPNGSLTVTDLKSSFGTHINGIKSAPHEETPVENKSLLKFGNECTMIRISKYVFCNTRLDKVDKERLSLISRAIGAEMSKKLESSSHLVCNRYSGTVSIVYSEFAKCSAVQCSVVQCSGVQWSAVECSGVQCSAV